MSRLPTVETNNILIPIVPGWKPLVGRLSWELGQRLLLLSSWWLLWWWAWLEAAMRYSAPRWQLLPIIRLQCALVTLSNLCCCIK